MTLYKVSQKITTFSCRSKKRKQSALVLAPEDAPKELIRERGLEQISWNATIDTSSVFIREPDVAMVSSREVADFEE